jgi:hypothetical protein
VSYKKETVKVLSLMRNSILLRRTHYVNRADSFLVEKGDGRVFLLPPRVILKAGTIRIAVPFQ